MANKHWDVRYDRVVDTLTRLPGIKDKLIITRIRKIIAEYESKYGQQPKSSQEEVDRLIWTALEDAFGWN